MYSAESKHAVNIFVHGVYLEGLLYIPKNAKGLVIFVHGSGSSRFSVRNQYVANILNDAGFATFLFDLFTAAEEELDQHSANLRFDIDLLVKRLIEVTKWCMEQLESYNLPIGYFGASTGGGAAIAAAGQLTSIIKAIVSRGGRPDLAEKYLTSVTAPVLLIVGENDEPVIEYNKYAMSKINAIKKMKIIPGAAHLFEEPGCLEEVARLTKEWFILNF